MNCTCGAYERGWLSHIYPCLAGKRQDVAKPQPPPTGEGAEVLPLVIRDLEERAKDGERKYGTWLRAHNGRDALVDAYQEALDLCMYLRQAIAERDGGE